MRQQQRGMAVLVVLLLIAVMTLITVTSSENFQQAARRASTQQFVLQARWSLLGAEMWLLQQPPATRTDMTGTLQLQQSLIHYRWRDRQACFNLNALAQPVRSAVTQSATPAGEQTNATTPVAPGAKKTAAQRIFLRLLAELQVPSPEASALLAQLSQRVSRGALNEISQLRDGATGISLPLWQRLAPLVCVQPPGRLQININGLRPQQYPLLQALSEGGFSAAQARQLLSNRPAEGWHALEQIIPPALAEQNDAAVATLLSAAVLKSNAWELLMWTAEDQSSYSLRSRISRQDGHLQVSDRLYGLSEEYSGDVF